jgi:crossover junction endodeoxyribonuclease RuvC
MRIIGIDPGLSGAVSVLKGLDLIEVFDMPTVLVRSGKTEKRQISEAMLAVTLRDMNISHAYLEFVHAMPGQGVTSMFNFGMGYGVIKGVLAALSIPMTTVPPSKWQKDLGMAKGKEANRARAAQLFPNQAGLFARVKDDGRADAALIGYWGVQNAYQFSISQGV